MQQQHGAPTLCRRPELTEGEAEIAMHGTHDDGELKGLERSLAGLRPAPAGIDRDELMFRAGQAAATGRASVAPALAVLAALVAALAGAGTMWLARPAGSERIVRVTVEKPVLRVVELSPMMPAGQSRERSVAGADYLELRNRLLVQGMDALPPLELAGGPARGDDIDELCRDLGIRPPRGSAKVQAHSTGRSAQS